MFRRQLKPIVGIPADRKQLGGMPFHAVGEKYIEAIHGVAECLPVLLPVLGARLDFREVLEDVDGILLTGSHSNIEPRHYNGAPSEPGTLHDPERDATTLPLIPKALAAGVPLLGICRGFQEMNVALGGSLHQLVHLQPGLADHREDQSRPLEERYELMHDISLNPGGMLARLAQTGSARVNSLHTQGVDRLAAEVVVEATAPDGLVEAFTVSHAPAFNLAVQWHPEWRARQWPLSAAIFRAFGDACRRRMAACGRAVGATDTSYAQDPTLTSEGC